MFGVASFYPCFALAPKGKYCLRLCEGASCHLKHSAPLLEAVRQRLGLSATGHTTADLLFTVETVPCLGACALGPVVVINQEVHARMTAEAVVGLIDAIEQRERLA